MFCALAFSSAVEIETNEISRLEKEIAEKKDWANRNKFSEEESGPNSPLGQALARNAKELKDLESRLGDLKKKPSSAVEIETNEISRLEKEIAEKKDWANRNKFSEEESGPKFHPLGAKHGSRQHGMPIRT